MSIFPALVPSVRNFQVGDYPFTPFGSLNKKENRVRHSNVMLNSQLRLTFTAVSELEMLSILTHYKEQYGTFKSFFIPSTIWQSVSSIAQFELANYGWRYLQSPQITDSPRGFYDIEIVLETVPPEGTALTGIENIVYLSYYTPGAFAANGIQRIINASFVFSGDVRIIATGSFLYMTGSTAIETNGAIGHANTAGSDLTIQGSYAFTNAGGTSVFDITVPTSFVDNGAFGELRDDPYFFDIIEAWTVWTVGISPDWWTI